MFKARSAGQIFRAQEHDAASGSAEIFQGELNRNDENKAFHRTMKSVRVVKILLILVGISSSIDVLLIVLICQLGSLFAGGFDQAADFDVKPT